MDLRPSPRAARNRPAAAPPAAVRRLLTADGVAISAAYDAPRGRTGLGFVVAHGFTGGWRRADSRRVGAGLAAYGGVVCLDLRGHGSSGGASTVGDAEVYDVAAGVQYARWLGHDPVVTVGFSLGGAVVLRQAALALQKDLGGGLPDAVRPDARTPDAAPDAVVTVSAAGFWFYQGTAPMRLLHRAVYTRTGRAVLRGAYGTRVLARPWVPPYPQSPVEAAAALAPRPLLVVHGDLDAYFPTEHAEAIVAAARQGARVRDVPDRTQYWLERGLGHAEAAVSPQLVDRIGAWAADMLGDDVPGGDELGGDMLGGDMLGGSVLGGGMLGDRRVAPIERQEGT